MFFVRVPAVIIGIAVITRERKHAVGYEVFACAVALNDSLNEVFGHVGIVGEQLLGVFGQAVAAVAERWVVVLHTDARVEADAFDNLLCIKTFHLGVCIKLVEVRHAEREVCVGEEFDSLGFGEAHEERVDVGFYGALLQQSCKGVRRLYEARVGHIGTDNDAARIEIVVEGAALAQELGREDEIRCVVLLARMFGKADRNGRLYHHYGIGVVLHNCLNDSFYRRCIEEVLLRVVVRRRGNDDKVGIAVSLFGVERCT